MGDSVTRLPDDAIRDYALKFYSIIADNYAPFYSTVIECTDRDAAYVLDGLLYNESDLTLGVFGADCDGTCLRRVRWF